MAAGISAVIGLYDKFHISVKEAKDAMNNSFDAYEDAKKNVASTNEELANTKARIEELQAKKSLTFVEQSELDKLKEANEQLTMQADLNAKEEERAAKEAGRSAAEAFNKEFEEPINTKTMDEYYNSAKSTGNTIGLFGDESNISAMIAGIKIMRELRDETTKGSEDYELYNEQITGNTDLVWKQADALLEYKTKLESVPFEDLGQSEKDALASVNASLDFIYKELDTNKWKQFTLDNILDTESFNEEKNRIVESAKSIGEEIESSDLSFGFRQAIEDAGLDVQEVVDNFNAEFGLLDTDVMRSQLSDSIYGSITGPLSEETEKALNLLNSLKPEEVEVLWKYVKDNDVDLSDIALEDLQSVLDSAMKSVQPVAEAIQQTFSDILSGKPFTEMVDGFQTNISAIQTALDSLSSGKDVDLTDLIQKFPKLAGQTQNLAQSLSELKADQVIDFISQMQNETKELSDDELEYANDFVSNFINGMDFSATDVATLRDKYEDFLDSSFSGMIGSERLAQIDIKLAGFDSFFDDYGNNIERSKQSTESFLSQIENVRNVLSSQGAGKTLDYDVYDSDALKDYQSALEYVNGSMQLNVDKVNDIVAAKADERLATLAQSKAMAQSKYLENAKQIEKLRDALRNNKDALGSSTQAIQDQISELLQENSTLAQNCTQYDFMSASIENATSAYQNWINAQNAPQSGDMFDSALTALQKIDDTLNNEESDSYGRIGNEDYKAALDFVIPDTVDKTDQTAVDSYIQSIEGLFTHNEKGLRDGLDITNFCEKAVDEGLMVFDDSLNSYKIAGEMTIDEFAEGMNLSLPLVEAMFGEMEEFGGEFKWARKGMKDMESLGVTAYEAAEALREIEGNEDLKISMDVSDFEDKELAIQTLGTTIEEMNQIKAKPNVDASEVEYANSVIEYCVRQQQLLNAPSVLKVDTSQVQGELGNALELLQDFQRAKNEVEVNASVGADTTEAEAKVDSLTQEIQGLSPEIKATLEINDTDKDTIISSIEALTPEMMVKAGVDQTLIDDFIDADHEAKGEVKWDNNKSLVDKYSRQTKYAEGRVNWLNNTTNVKKKFTAPGYINWTNTSPPSSSSSSSSSSRKISGPQIDVNGTAHAGGSWGTTTGGKTLVGELGRKFFATAYGNICVAFI